MTAPASSPDPFALTANTGLYVPRAATEAALDALTAALAAERSCALAGPPGLGKTLLLHLLAERLRPRLEPVTLPYAVLPPEDLCAWALAALGSPGCEEPERVLRNLVYERGQRGPGLLLLLDDAGSLPLATARWLGELAESHPRGLRFVLAATDNAGSSRTIAALGPRIELVRLVTPMSEAETDRYLDQRLDACRVAPELRARFDAATRGELFRLSAGIPRRLHAAAAQILRGATTPELAEDAILDHASAVGATGPPADPRPRS